MGCPFFIAPFFISNVYMKRLSVWNWIIEDVDKQKQLLGVIVINATFNNISAMSWQSVVLVKETGVPREHNRPATSR